MGYNSKDVKSMTDAELIYVSEKIKSEAEQNENYKDYKGSVKWQKEVRSQASRDMQELLSQNNTMINQIGEQVDKVDELREKWKNEKDPGQRKTFYNALKMERASLNTLRDTYGPKINENMSKFQELRNRKETAEEKILNGMRKQALHSETKAILADVESEIEERGESRKEVNISSNANKPNFTSFTNFRKSTPEGSKVKVTNHLMTGNNKTTDRVIKKMGKEHMITSFVDENGKEHETRTDFGLAENTRVEGNKVSFLAHKTIDGFGDEVIEPRGMKEGQPWLEIEVE